MDIRRLLIAATLFGSLLIGGCGAGEGDDDEGAGVPGTATEVDDD